MYKVETLRHEEPDSRTLFWDKDSNDGVAWRVVDEKGVVLAIYDNAITAHDVRNNLNVCDNPIILLKKQGIDTRLLEVAMLNNNSKEDYSAIGQTDQFYQKEPGYAS